MYQSLKGIFCAGNSVCEPATFYGYKITIKLTLLIYLFIFYDAVLITCTSLLFDSKYVPINLQSNTLMSHFPHNSISSLMKAEQ